MESSLVVDVLTLLVLGFVSGLIIAVATAPIGVSGAVFLLPVQLTVLGVPSPSVTPTNLLFNIVSIPGALARYGRRAPLHSPLTKLMLMLIGTLPGVVIGAALRVFFLPGEQEFRILVSALLLPLGIWLCTRALRPAHSQEPVSPSNRSVGMLALAVGVVGGIYGIGGGSLLSPILVGRGLPIKKVAPAALTATFFTSIVGAGTYALLDSITDGPNIAPDWTIGLVCGSSGLVGGYLGAYLQPALPEKALKLTLGAVAISTAILYAAQVIE